MENGIVVEEPSRWNKTKRQQSVEHETVLSKQKKKSLVSVILSKGEKEKSMSIVKVYIVRPRSLKYFGFLRNLSV